MNFAFSVGLFIHIISFGLFLFVFSAKEKNATKSNKKKYQ